MQSLVHKLTVYLVIVVLALIGAATFALMLLVRSLPAKNRRRPWSGSCPVSPPG